MYEILKNKGISQSEVKTTVEKARREQKAFKKTWKKRENVH